MAEIPVDIVLFERHHGAPDTRPFPGVRQVRPSGALGRARCTIQPELVALHILNVAISQNLLRRKRRYVYPLPVPIL